MLMEGTGKYFLMLFLVFLVVYIAVKISLGVLLKRAKEQSWKAYVPVYTTLVLVDLLHLNRKYFYFSLIPFVGLYYLYVIIGELLKGFNENPKEAIWYVVFPMYNFPKLAFKKPKFVLNEYDLTEEFLETQNILFEQPKEVVVEPVITDISEPVDNQDSLYTDYNYITPSENQIGPSAQRVNTEENVVSNNDSVFTNESLEPDKAHTTYVEVKEEEPKEEKPIITPVETGRPKMCPNCGAKLSPGATACFLCGTKL